MDLKARIQNDMKDAMRAKEQLRLSTIRMLMAAIKQREIDERIELDDGAIIAVINKMIKQRRDSFKQFQEAGRHELAEKEGQEIDILQSYLPAQLSDAEISAAVSNAVKTTGATSVKDMGKVMGILKAQLEGRADMAVVSKKIKEHFDS